MVDRPILFSPPMVRALLAGTKTQTRRVHHTQEPDFRTVCDLDCDERLSQMCNGKSCKKRTVTKARFSVGDRLYVRERGAIAASKTAFLPFAGNEQSMDTKSPAWPRSPDGTPYKACPGIHMPRWASRLTLIVTDVRVQRLQDISAEDCRAEGHPVEWDRSPNREVHDDAARDWFSDLWDSLNADRGYGWAANPWVVAISFTVHRKNIDEMEAAHAA